ncbi:MAG TPA: hypothetical protein VIY47_04290 [Ignavibacteriaceae bacterium]
MITLETLIQRQIRGPYLQILVDMMLDRDADNLPTELWLPASVVTKKYLGKKKSLKLSTDFKVFNMNVVIHDGEDLFTK